MPPSSTVLLRTRTAADFDVLYDLAAELHTWEERSPSAPGPLTRERYETQLASRENASSDNVSFVVDVDGKPVGSVSLFGCDSLARHAEAGISLIAEARGRGIGTAAMRQLVEFGFLRRNLRRIHLETIASNVSAIRAYEKAGFVVEGRLREHAWVRGAYVDILIMGILQSDPRT